jgi:UPF0176 protein
MFKVLLYYKYVELADPEKFRNEQFDLCSRLGLKGRILISSEGLNGTVGGSEESINEYMEVTKSYPEFSDMEWKISYSDIEPFPKLRVVVREEVVTLKALVDVKNRAEYIEPQDLRKILDETPDEVVIIDARNNYESQIGKFKNAIAPDISNFRDWPAFVESIKDLKDKPVITYCTGGIRCEKASAYLVEQGFKNVRQLHGGIVRYGEETGGKDFEGNCYVFDNRIHVPVNSVNPEIISECKHCKNKSLRYINCCNAKCNIQFICCEDCHKEYEGGCCRDCQSKSRYKTNADSKDMSEEMTASKSE